MKVVIQQVDMDTCLTGLILGVSAADQLEVVRSSASADDLANPDVLCIEAGGSGQTHLENYDHHESGGSKASACRQAWDLHGMSRLAGFSIRGGHGALERLVQYVEIVDTGGPTALPPAPAPGFPTLSALFSGMRLSLRDPAEQFCAGLAIFQTVLEKGLHPFGLMPEQPEWHGYLEAKRRDIEGMAKAKAVAEVFTTRSGRRAGFLETEFIGAVGALYELGCDIAIAYNPRFCSPSGGEAIAKYTIAGNNGLRVDNLLPHLNPLEPGWGGPAHGTIIASPRKGSSMVPEKVKALVRDRV
jgi:hypothetical protein